MSGINAFNLYDDQIYADRPSGQTYGQRMHAAGALPSTMIQDRRSDPPIDWSRVPLAEQYGAFRHDSYIRHQPGNPIIDSLMPRDRPDPKLIQDMMMSGFGGRKRYP